MEQRFITADEATALLPEGEYIHTFKNPGPNVLLGADLTRERIIELFKENSGKIEIGGELSRNMKHALVIREEGSGPLFIANNPEKLEAFDPMT